MWNVARMLVCCAMAVCAVPSRADESATSEPNVPCCGRDAGAVPQPAAGATGSQSGSVSSDLSNCVCLKYIYAQWGDGTCGFYATNCFASPFSWTDSCYSPHPLTCDANSCGTCLTYPEMPAPRGGPHDRPLASLPDHTFRPHLPEGAGASFFEEPFFVSMRVPGREEPLKVKVFPILVARRQIEDRVLPAQVFYSGVEIEGFPEGVKARPVRGEILGPFGCRAIDHQRVLQVLTYSRIAD